MGLSDAIESLKRVVLGDSKDAPKMPAGSDDAQPTGKMKEGVLISLPIAPDPVTFCDQWWGEVNKSDDRIKARAEKWDILLEEYIPVVEKTGTPEAVKTNRHFRNIHTRMAQLFYRCPDLFLEPYDPSPAQMQQPNPMQATAPMNPMTGIQVQLPPITMEDIVSVKAALLNRTLGRDGIKAHRLMDELLFDVLGWAGIGVAKVGYRCVVKPIQQPVMGPPPMPMMPAGVLGLQQPQPPMDPTMPPPPMVPQSHPVTGAPLMQTIQVPVFEEEYARRVSPKKFISNADWKTQRLDDDATVAGMHFYLDPKRAQRDFDLTDEEITKATADDKVFKYKEDSANNAATLMHGVELWVKASYYTDEVHPQALCQLILFEGVKRPVVWRMSPYQEFDDRGRLTQDSMIGFPILYMNIRPIADTPFTPSDAAFVNNQVKELNTYRRQGVQLRDAAIGKVLMDADAFNSDDDMKAMKEGEAGATIFVKGGTLANGVGGVMASTVQITRTMDDYKGQEIIDRDMDSTLAINNNSAGIELDTGRTATENANMQGGARSRNDKDRGYVIDFYLDLARKVDSLLMRFTDQDKYMLVAGPDGAKRMMIWQKSVVAGKYLYDIAPDSQMAPDNAVGFKQDLDYYNLAAPDPLFNRAYMMRRLARHRGLDPSKVVLDPSQMMNQPPHGGGPVNQHMNSNSGKRTNEPGAVNRREEQTKPQQPQAQP